MNAVIRFGVAGNPPNFWTSGFCSDRGNAPIWLQNIGLNALEIQCTYGVRMPTERIDLFRANSKTTGVLLSVHAPYYINIGSGSRKTVANSLVELRKSVVLARALGSTRVVFHPGGAGDDRAAALSRAVAALKKLERDTDLGPVRLYPEIAGKVGQLGSLDEILHLCGAVGCACPCLDLAHLHAREHGSLRTKEDFARVLAKVRDVLGSGALKDLHVHLYPVAWGFGGEMEHKAFHDALPEDGELLFRDLRQKEKYYLPRFEPFLDVVCDMGLSPVVICEAKDSQDTGALAMQSYYRRLIHERG